MNTSTTDEHLQMVSDCEARESRLTEWEGEFLDSVRRQIEAGRSLSERQAEILDGIWEKATEKG